MAWRNSSQRPGLLGGRGLQPGFLEVVGVVVHGPHRDLLGQPVEGAVAEALAVVAVGLDDLGEEVRQVEAVALDEVVQGGPDALRGQRGPVVDGGEHHVRGGAPGDQGDQLGQVRGGAVGGDLDVGVGPGEVLRHFGVDLQLLLVPRGGPGEGDVVPGQRGGPGAGPWGVPAPSAPQAARAPPARAVRGGEGQAARLSRSGVSHGWSPPPAAPPYAVAPAPAYSSAGAKATGRCAS